MRLRFLFFDIKRNYLINILIILQIALWIFFTSSLLSLSLFNNSFKEKCERSFPVDTSASFSFNDKICDINSKEDIYKEILKITSYIEKHGYKFGFRSSSFNYNPDKITVPLSSLHAGKKEMKVNFVETEGYYHNLQPYYMDKNVIESYIKNIDGTVDLSNWKNTNTDIPVVLGYNFSKKNHIGDKIIIKNKTYKIIGFFKKDTLTTEESEITNGAYSLDASFVIPMDVTSFLKDYNSQPVTLYSKNKINEHDLENVVKNYSTKLHVKSVRSDLNSYLKELNSQKQYKIIRLSITSIIIICALFLTLAYEIEINKDRIGLLFSIGISKRNIFLILSYEFSLLSFIGLGLGSILYLKFYKRIALLYINQTLMSSLYISILSLILIFFIILRSNFYLVNKLTPKEMIGGFVE